MGELTAEIRWWARGRVPEAIARWYEGGAVVPGGGSRTDRYLKIDSPTVGLKYRGGGDGLEVKSLVEYFPIAFEGARQGEAGIWIKHGLASSIEAPSIAIAKCRQLRLFDRTGGTLRELTLGPDETPVDTDWPAEGCTVELTEVTRKDAQWWSVCFEAFGPLERVADILPRILDKLAPLPETLAEARQASYPEWLADPE